jgi:hypothetical protein
MAASETGVSNTWQTAPITTADKRADAPSQDRVRQKERIDQTAGALSSEHLSATERAGARNEFAAANARRDGRAQPRH